MKNAIIVILIIFGLTNAGCDKFINGLVVDIDVPEQEPVLVPYCFIDGSDSEIKVYVQKSQDILDSTNVEYIEDATVQLFKEGVFWKNLTRDVNLPKNPYTVLLDQPILFEGFGVSYELRVSAPGYETVTATQIMPSLNTIVDVEFLRNAASDFGELIDNARITINDIPDEENYYRVLLDIFEIGLIPNGDTVSEARSVGGQALANTESMSNALDGVVITDQLFDGERFIADVGSVFSGSTSSGTSEPITYSGTVEIRLLSITRDEYLYQKSLYSYANAQENPFTEPTLLYSNTSSGLGMFSMMMETKERFEY